MDKAVDKKLKTLFNLQTIDSQIDDLRKLRGELPIEVADLEDEIQGLETRQNKFTDELNDYVRQINEQYAVIKESEILKEKYETQLNKIKNSREYDALSKEIELQDLEIQLANKKINEYEAKKDFKEKEITEIQEVHEGRKKDLENKASELEKIVAETEKEEKELLTKSEDAGTLVEERLIVAYKRIRNGARNGLAVVKVERDSCGGCFNQIPPQRQLDIRSRKKIIICEHCGRVLVDEDIDGKGPVRTRAKAPKKRRTSRKKTTA